MAEFDPVKMGQMIEAVHVIRQDVAEIKQDVKRQNGNVARLEKEKVDWQVYSLRDDDKENRISKLENWRWYVVGIVTAVAATITIIVKVIK